MFKRAAGTALIALWLAAAATAADAQESAESGEENTHPPPQGVIGAVETDRPVRPSELPPDTIPEVHPEGTTKAEPPPRTSASVARAPLPDQASGVSHGESRPTGEKLKFIPRALLFVPRLALAPGE